MLYTSEQGTLEEHTSRQGTLEEHTSEQGTLEVHTSEQGTLEPEAPETIPNRSRRASKGGFELQSILHAISKKTSDLTTTPPGGMRRSPGKGFRTGKYQSEDFGYQSNFRAGDVRSTHLRAGDVRGTHFRAGGR